MEFVHYSTGTPVGAQQLATAPVLLSGKVDREQVSLVFDDDNVI